MREALTQILSNRLTAAGFDPNGARVELDETDPNGQTLLIWYPATTPHSDYVRAAIKIESRAKSALDPNREVPIKPYVDDDLPALDLRCRRYAPSSPSAPSGTRSSSSTGCAVGSTSGVNSKAAVNACRGTIMTFIVAWRLRFANLIDG